MNGLQFIKITLVLLVWSIYPYSLEAQTTLVVEGIPEKTPTGQDIYISGDFEGWTGGQDSYRLSYANGKYFILLPETEKTILFKFTRGNWDTVETDLDGKQIDNRSLFLSGVRDTVNFVITQWADLVPKKSTASKNVHLLDDSFDMSPLEKTRKIWIYLPDSYENSTERYPVVYLQDGQNLFDESLAYSGEWEVDETLDQLAGSKVLELIVVGIENGGAERIEEYTPWEITGHESKLLGDDYIRFIKENLKPFIDENYRTKSSRDQTGIMGSSLGGLISFYAALQYPETFGKAGIFSPSFSLVEKSSAFTEQHGDLKETDIYFMAGDQESESMVEEMKKQIQLLIDSGFPEKNIATKVVQGGEHNEKLWSEQFEPAIKWLFANTTKH